MTPMLVRRTVSEDELADTAEDLLGTGHRVALVAAHHDDLQAARRCGLRTAYIERPLEFGARQPKDVSPQAGNDLHATSLVDLADQLGC